MTNDFLNYLDDFVEETESNNFLTSREQAREMMKVIKEDNSDVTDDIDIEEFRNEWNYLVCLYNPEVVKNGRVVDRLDVMSESMIARAIRETFNSYDIDDLYDYVFEKYIDRDEAVQQWAENQEYWD